MVVWVEGLTSLMGEIVFFIFDMMIDIFEVSIAMLISGCFYYNEQLKILLSAIKSI